MSTRFKLAAMTSVLLTLVAAVGMVAAAQTPTCGGEPVTIAGTSADDVIQGTEGADVIDGGDGNDEISGLGGNDIICGGSGNDQITGGPGKDVLSGGAGKDKLRGGGGNDTLDGGGGRDKLLGQGGNDELAGGAKPDVLKGGNGDDLIYGDVTDTIDGGEGTDTCSSEADRQRAGVVNCETGNLAASGDEFDVDAEPQVTIVVRNEMEMEFEANAGGPVDASYLGEGISGYGSVAPTLVVDIRPFAPSTIVLEVELADTPSSSGRAEPVTYVRICRNYYGRWFCQPGSESPLSTLARAFFPASETGPQPVWVLVGGANMAIPGTTAFVVQITMQASWGLLLD